MGTSTTTTRLAVTSSYYVSWLERFANACLWATYNHSTGTTPLTKTFRPAQTYIRASARSDSEKGVVNDRSVTHANPTRFREGEFSSVRYRCVPWRYGVFQRGDVLTAVTVAERHRQFVPKLEVFFLAAAMLTSIVALSKTHD
jgi:hypothetical protein